MDLKYIGLKKDNIFFNFIPPKKNRNSKLLQIKWEHPIKQEYENNKAKKINLWDWNICIKPIGGLIKLGNSYFINAGLQCIIHTIPFYIFCLKKNHYKNCIKHDFCSFCLIEKLINQIYKKNYYIIDEIFNKMNDLSSRLKLDQRQDPHEFIQSLLYSMHKCSLVGFQYKLKINSILEYTTPIYRFWGCIMRSTIQCCNCSTFNHNDKSILGISLNIEKINTLKKALYNYLQVDNLTRKRKIICKNCKEKCHFIKKISFLKPPLILYIHLKRFGINHTEKKKLLSKPIIFEITIDLSPFFFKYPKLTIRYILFSVLVHSGNYYSNNYYSYCKLSGEYSKSWYCIKDLNIFRVSIQKVLNSRAYIICYQKQCFSLRIRTTKTNLKKKTERRIAKLKKLHHLSHIKNDFLVQLRLKLFNLNK